MNDTLGLILTSLSIVLVLCTLMGLFARYVALPWFREHLVTPVQETKHQVTVNGHVSREPTMLDKVDSLATEVQHLRTDVTAAAGMFEGHIGASEDETGRIWAAIKDLQRKRNRP